MHYNEKQHLCSHKAPSVCVHVSPSSEPEYLRPLSLMIWMEQCAVSHTPLFKSLFYPKHPHNTLFFFFPSFLSTLEYPVFHSAAQ